MLGATPGLAQLSNNLSPGTTDLRAGDRREELEQAMREARWRWGKLRVEPTLGLRDMSWVTSSTSGVLPDRESGPAGSVGAGLQAYLPLGSRIVAAGHLRPELTFWPDRRTFDADAGLGLYGFFNRFSIRLEGSRAEDLDVAVPELAQATAQRIENASLAIESSLGGSLSFVGAASQRRTTSLEEEESLLERIDRQETSYRAGLRLRVRRFSLGLGLETFEATFDAADCGCDSRSTGPSLELSFEGSRFSAWGDVVHRDVRLEGRSRATTTGTLQIDITPRHRFSYSVYAHRFLGPTLAAGYGYFEGTRVGGALSVTLGWRTDARLFVESGANDYRASEADLEDRHDGYVGYGADATLPLWKEIRLELGIRRAGYDSGQDALNRTTTMVNFGISLGSAWPWDR